MGGNGEIHHYLLGLALEMRGNRIGKGSIKPALSLVRP